MGGLPKKLELKLRADQKFAEKTLVEKSNVILLTVIFEIWKNSSIENQVKY